ncbi:dicarboxylate/amino acid:cation symporter [Aerococcaceae bacterium NML210727]|nr:dicarboxylate/amino acid:cation symporter [Aerococcaceae bacterium NML210727]MCW6655007.1 dicarboxylate/amino acid:cation symporter [Aerococcaceae bacterium NML201296]MCW6663467.1 dicarboxylate/amino acid:cation symporter [Aerococcaceae bacterium NML190073]
MKQKQKKNSLVVQIVIAVILGGIMGSIMPDFSNYFKVIGDLFLKLMQMSIPLLVLGQIVQAIGGIEAKELKKFGTQTLLIFGVSSLLASIWGVLAAYVFRPGEGVVINVDLENVIESKSLLWTDTLLGFFPSNIFDALSKGSIIQIIVFACFFGLALNRFMQRNPESQLFKTISDFNEVIMNIIRLVMTLAPIGVFCLIGSSISDLGTGIILPLVKYLVIYSAATIVFLIFWIIVVCAYCKIGFVPLIRNMRQISIVAIVTISSAVTLPIAIDDAKAKLGISKRITELVLPLGVSLNSNGSAMFMSITVVTIMQLYQIDFNLQTLVYLSIMATLVSLANAVVPGGGLVSLAIIVPQMGLPIESIAIFAGVEWFTGIIRTILNVNSDVYTAILVAAAADELDVSCYK